MKKYHNFIRNLFLCLFLLLIAAQAESGDLSKAPLLDELGFSAGYSVILAEELDNQEQYYPLLLMGTISLNLTRKRTAAGSRGRLLWYFEPQINPVIYRDRFSEIEFGATVIGLKYRYNFSPRFCGYAMIGSGPHFISVVCDKQASGYIFSDNFAIGICKYGPGGTGINLQLRYRHISNAGIMEPNWGIDNLFLVGGMEW
ncbi:MAG: hypothetical protein GF401_10025 [Chitinivibrionales bacterium]|nr:hypothetical protein [Chitinivibrionales bacterium]